MEEDREEIKDGQKEQTSVETAESAKIVRPLKVKKKTVKGGIVQHTSNSPTMLMIH